MRARLHPDRHDCLMHNPWNEYVLPRMTDQLLDNRTVAGYRERAAAKLTGEVVEIGFGSGLNVPRIPKASRRSSRSNHRERLAISPANEWVRPPSPSNFADLTGSTFPLPMHLPTAL